MAEYDTQMYQRSPIPRYDTVPYVPWELPYKKHACKAFTKFPERDGRTTEGWECSANYNTGGVVCLIVRSFKVVRATSVNECTLLSTLALIVAAGEDTSMHMMRAHRPRHFFFVDPSDALGRDTVSKCFGS